MENKPKQDEAENNDMALHLSSNEVECNNIRQQSQGFSNTQNEILPKTLPALYSSQKINNTVFLSDFKQPRSFSSTMQRMFSGINAESNESRYRKSIQVQINSFRRFQDREEDVYLRTAFRHHKIPGLGQRIKDKGVIEAIANAKNNEWRKLVIEENMNPLEANEKSGITAIGRISMGDNYASTKAFSNNDEGSSKTTNNFKLPSERKIINEARKRRMKGPVLYWGCGKF